MLSPLDDTLHHQLGTTFDHAGTSDPRFFDRYWFAMYDPHGSEPAINVGLCTYLNMNVVDGYCSMIQDGKQYNVRVSDALRPRLFTADPNVSSSGPLTVSVVEPFKKLRLQLEPNDSGIAFDLDWIADLPPHEELPNFTRLRGRVNQDYVRYNQSGAVNGWIELNGNRRQIRDWWGGRDHSWGVRTDVAGGEPVTGDDDMRSARGGFLWTWITWGGPGIGGHVQLHEVEDGTKVHEDGMIQWSDGSMVTTHRVDLAFDVYPGTRRFRTGAWHLHTRQGDWTIEMTPISRSLSMLGLGYSMGYTDRRGFGVWRGENFLEYDVYDVSHEEDVVLPDGTVDRPYHRDCAVTLKVTGPDGKSFVAAGHAAIIPSGNLPRRGLPIG
jgi:hypothetical protein